MKKASFAILVYDGKHASNHSSFLWPARRQSSVTGEGEGDKQFFLGGGHKNVVPLNIKSEDKKRSSLQNLPKFGSCSRFLVWRLKKNDDQYFGGHRPQIVLQWHRACDFLWGVILAWGAQFSFGWAQAVIWGGTASKCPPVAPGLMTWWSDVLKWCYLYWVHFVVVYFFMA